VSRRALASTFILDQLSVSAAAAYSLRRLRAAHMGSADRVRRSSDNAEANIGFATAVQTRTNLAAIPINNDSGQTIGGVTMTTVGTGTEFGQPYIDVRWQGTAGGTAFLTLGHGPRGVFNPALQAPVTPGLNYTASVGYRLLAGTPPTTTFVQVVALFFSAAGTFLTDPTSTVPAATAALQRGAAIGLAPAGAAYCQPIWRVLASSGTVVDFTMRFYAANVELGTGNARPLLQRNVPEVVANIGDYDAEAVLAHVGSGDGFVVTRYDQSGNGRNATKSTPEIQPPIVRNGALITENGRPYIDFTGDKGLVISNYNALLAFTAAVLKSDTSVFSGFHTIFDGSGVGIIQRNGGIVEGNQTYVHANVYPTAVWKNGAALANPFDLAPITTPFQVSIQNVGGLVSTACIGNYDSGSLGGAAKESETIVFSSVPSTTDRQTLEINQARYYGITDAIPALKFTTSNYDLIDAPWPMGALSVRASIASRPASPVSVRILAANLAALSIAVDLDTSGRLAFSVGDAPVVFFNLGAATLVRVALSTTEAGALLAAVNGEILDLSIPSGAALTQTMAPRESHGTNITILEMAAYDAPLGSSQLIVQTGA
jgi:hypothetical protein